MNHYHNIFGCVFLELFLSRKMRDLRVWILNVLNSLSSSMALLPHKSILLPWMDANQGKDCEGRILVRIDWLVPNKVGLIETLGWSWISIQPGKVIRKEEKLFEKKLVSISGSQNINLSFFFAQGNIFEFSEAGSSSDKQWI